MQISLTDTIDPNTLELLICSETKIIKRPSRIRLSTSSNDYVIHNSYIVKSVIFDICIKKRKEKNPLQRGHSKGHRCPRGVYSPINL